MTPRAAASRSTRNARQCAIYPRSARLIAGGGASYRWTAFSNGRQSRGASGSLMRSPCQDGAPFAIAGIWENWKDPNSGEWIRTFAIVTTDANELVADIHDRMPVILSRYDYVRWLGEEPDPRELMRPFPAGLMRMWPISTRVNKPENDDPIEPIEEATDAA